ncbi:MAG: hypothetical protein ORN24_06355, partial [Burkholderiales bacterium]|nr:hypothetical protein [Burkholderiales bacterium]
MNKLMCLLFVILSLGLNGCEIGSSIRTNNGLLTFENSTSGVNLVLGMAISPNGNFAYVTNSYSNNNTVSQFSITSNGQLTPLA